jgi:tripartite-type tricarboxylate transporter receptor subunit TctC
MTTLHHTLCFALTAIVMAADLQIAQAENESLPPLRLVVPCKVGSPNDLMARIVAQSLSERSGRKVIVENLARGADVPPDEHSAVFNVLDCVDESGPLETAMTER